MAGRSKIVPVLTSRSPTGITCQSTCLTMVATYLERSVVMQNTGAGTRDITGIWKDINEDLTLQQRGSGAPAMSSPEFKIVVHDLYGSFDPSL